MAEMRHKSQEENLADHRRERTRHSREQEEVKRQRRHDQDQERNLREQLKDKEQRLQSQEQKLQNLKSQIRQLSSQKAAAVTPKKKTRKTKSILKDLIKQWDHRWAKLRHKDQEVRSQGGTPKDMFNVHARKIREGEK